MLSSEYGKFKRVEACRSRFKQQGRNKNLRIGEVSRSYGISVDNLYYYINYGLLVPKKPKGQYDFDQQTLRDLDLILELKDMKFSLYRISSLAGEGDTEDLKRLYEKKLCELQDDIAFTQKNIAKLEDKISELNS